MTIEEIRDYCLAKPGVTEGFPFEETKQVFKMMNKMFALLDLSEDSRGISLKCDPELAIELQEQHPEMTPAWHFNKIIILLSYTVKDGKVNDDILIGENKTQIQHHIISFLSDFPAHTQP